MKTLALVANEGLRLTTTDSFRSALEELISATDFANIGSVKMHKIDDPARPGEQIDGPDAYLTVSARLAKDAITIGGEPMYPNTAQVKFDFFRLGVEPGGVRTTTAKAASIDVNSLKARLTSPEAQAQRAALAKKATDNKVVAVAAERK